jgi:hypothetical protein
MNFAIYGAGFRGLMFVVWAGAAFAAQPAPAADPFGEMAGEFTFNEFCRANPTAALPVGEQPVWVEWLVAEAAVLPDQPTAAMLQTGRLVRQVTRLNRCAATEQWQLVDRAPDGSSLAAPQRIGSALFTRLLPDKDGRVAMVYHSDWVRLSGWIKNASGLPEAVCERASHHSSLTLNPGEWVKLGGSSVERVTKTVSGEETTSKMENGFYLRVLTKPDPSWKLPE